jgi:hypothetical protein
MKTLTIILGSLLVAGWVALMILGITLTAAAFGVN